MIRYCYHVSLKYRHVPILSPKVSMLISNAIQKGPAVGRLLYYSHYFQLQWCVKFNFEVKRMIFKMTICSKTDVILLFSHCYFFFKGVVFRTRIFHCHMTDSNDLFSIWLKIGCQYWSNIVKPENFGTYSVNIGPLWLRGPCSFKMIFLLQCCILKVSLKNCGFRTHFWKVSFQIFLFFFAFGKNIALSIRNKSML